MLAPTLALLFAVQTEPVSVSVLQVDGSVEYRSPEKSKKWAKLNKEIKLAIGDQVQTGLKSRCLIQAGESTRVLIRASSFATLSKAYIDKNKLNAEFRLDVGSVYIQVDDAKPDEVDFRVSTPIGTASVRGSDCLVVADEMGGGIFNPNGNVFGGDENNPWFFMPTPDLLAFFNLLNSDPSALTGLFPGSGSFFDVFGQLNLPNNPIGTFGQGNQNFIGPQQFNQGLQGIGDCQLLSFGSPFSIFFCNPAMFWGIFLDPNDPFLADVKPFGPLSGVRGAPPQSFMGMIRNQPVFDLQNLGFPSAQSWQFVDLLTGQRFFWDPQSGTWIPDTQQQQQIIVGPTEN